VEAYCQEDEMDHDLAYLWSHASERM
jgi:hypothetical protein